MILHPSVVEAITKPIEHLDVAIAYLRRVHFVSFYSGRRYRDESHLLAMAPSVMYRSRPFAPAPNENQAYSVHSLLGEMQKKAESGDVALASDEVEEEKGQKVMEESYPPAENEGESDRPVSSKEEEEETVRMDREDRLHDPHNDNEADSAVATDSASQKPPFPPLPLPSSSPSASRLSFKHVSPLHDRKIGPIIADLTQKLAIKKARVVDPSLPGNIDEEDAKQLESLQEKTMQALIAKHCKFEQDDKCRCCFSYCNKLFRQVQFLSKHLKMKHPEFGVEIFLQDAEPFMRKRYEAEDMSARPLPPVAVESFGIPTSFTIAIREISRILSI